MKAVVLNLQIFCKLFINVILGLELLRGDYLGPVRDLIQEGNAA
jgi:hypothetical protein